MNRPLAFAIVAALASSAAARADCPSPADALPVSRIVEIDTSTGPIYGDMTKRVKEDSLLGPKEVVLTFDDGPMPSVTTPILEVLDRYCTKATFFYVGQMALAYPAVVKDVIARGHTVGTHTWSHPMSLPRRSFEKATTEIDKGFAAVALAAGQPIAPFFRFPGLNDSDPLLAHLQSKGVAAFTVDVVSNDSYTASPQRLAERVIREVTRKDGGIILFHDIKKSTAKALPDILAWLKTNGYKVVHLIPKAPMPAVAGYDAELAPKLAKTAAPAADKEHPVPASADPKDTAAATVVANAATATAAEPPVTTLSPAARSRAPLPTEPEVAASETEDGARGKASTERNTARLKRSSMRRKVKRPALTQATF